MNMSHLDKRLVIFKNIVREFRKTPKVLKTKELGERIGLTAKLTERACIRLKYAGVLKSKTGPKGGYYLAESDISIKQMLLAIEAPILFSGVPELDNEYKRYLERTI